MTNFRTKNTRLPETPEEFADKVLQHTAAPKYSAIKHKAGKTAAEYGVSRPFGRVNYNQQTDRSLRAHEEVVHGLLAGSSDFATQEQLSKANPEEHMIRTFQASELVKRVDGEDQTGKPWHEQQLYPRKWYDTVLPFNLPWDHRETVAEAKVRLQVLGDAASWRTERNRRAHIENNLKWGTLLFITIVFVLAALPIVARVRMGGTASHGCDFGKHHHVKAGGLLDCEVMPYPRIAMYCALAIICVFKFATLDITFGPEGAMPRGYNEEDGTANSLRFVEEDSDPHWLPRFITGAVPESQRDGCGGLYGIMERLMAIWHGCLGGSLVAVLLLVVDFSQRMRDDFTLRAMSGGPAKGHEVILAQSGSLDNSNIDLSMCLAMHESQVAAVASEFFGMRNLVLFMCGAILIGLGELFKLRAVQDWPAKGFLDMDVLLRISKPWLWCREILDLKALASEAADDCWKYQEAIRLKIEESDEIQNFQKAAKLESDPIIHQHVETLCESATTCAELLMSSKMKNEMVGAINRGRILWAAAMQMAGVALWVPASQAKVAPCLHEMSRWSLLMTTAGSPVDRVELFAFVGICICIAMLIFIVYMLFIPYELQSMMICNPMHWHVKIDFVQRVYQRLYPARHWLTLVVDGVLIVCFGTALLFGQSGSDWLEPPKDRTWLVLSPWGLWRLVVFVYIAEVCARLVGTHVIVGRGIARASTPEEAAYTAQVQMCLLEILHQVGEAGGPFHDVQNMLGATSAKVRQLVYENNKATKFESSTESEGGDPLHGWTRHLRDAEDSQLAVADLEASLLINDGSLSARDIQKASVALPPAPPPQRILQEFVVDNRWLKAETDGLGFRRTKDLDDHDMVKPVAPWYSSVFGYDEQDGWVRLEDGSFLPSFMNDIPVLTDPGEGP